MFNNEAKKKAEWEKSDAARSTHLLSIYLVAYLMEKGKVEEPELCFSPYLDRNMIWISTIYKEISEQRLHKFHEKISIVTWYEFDITWGSRWRLRDLRLRSLRHISYNRLIISGHRRHVHLPRNRSPSRFSSQSISPVLEPIPDLLHTITVTDSFSEILEACRQGETQLLVFLKLPPFQLYQQSYYQIKLPDF